jgi:hypothetical protein
MYEYTAANFAECCAWGNWLRETEAFSLDDEAVEAINPVNGWFHNLQVGVGEIILTLGS